MRLLLTLMTEDLENFKAEILRIHKDELYEADLEKEIEKR